MAGFAPRPPVVPSASASWPQRYGIALGTAAVAFFVRLWVDPFVADSVAFLFFVPAILVTAMFAGAVPGLAVTVVGALISHAWFVAPEGGLRFEQPDHALNLILFVVVGAGIVWLTRERRRIEAERLAAIAVAEAAKGHARTEAMFKAVLESAPDAVVTVDEGGTMIVVNSQTEALFGYARPELLGKPVEMLLPGPARDAHVRHRFGYLAAPRTRPMGAGLDLYGRRRDGTLFPAEISLSPLQLDDRLLVTAVVRDVTDKRRMGEERARLAREQALRSQAEAAERRSQFLVKVSSVLSATLDYEATLGGLAGLMVPELADWCAVHVRKPTGAIEPMAIAHASPEETRRGWEIARQIPIDGTGPAGLAEVIRTGRSQLHADISDALLDAQGPGLGEALRQLAPQSAMIVAFAVEREGIGTISFIATRESGRRYEHQDLVFAEDVARRAGVAVENARLYREAQEANRLKDEFLAILSHELRTPLSAVLGWARMLSSGRLDAATTQRAVAAIERNAEAQAQLIGDLLDISRIVSGNFQLQPSAVDLAVLVATAVDAVRFAAESRGITIETEFEPGARLVTGDPDRLRQVLWNLLSNSVKFTPRNGRVSVRLTKSGNEVAIVVTDTGIGIAPAFLPYVFDRFRQADSTTTRQRGGLGLGLAIVRHLVELHGGSVLAESEGEGRGARFTVLLPLDFRGRTTAVAPQPAVEPGVSKRDGGDTRLENIDVLVVDDERDARDMLTAMLASHGARVRSAASVAEAIRELQRSRPDVIVSDIGMPGADGYELLARVRGLERGGTLPVIALSAYAQPQDVGQIAAAGFDAHLAKPVEPDDLVAAVADAAGARSR